MDKLKIKIQSSSKVVERNLTDKTEKRLRKDGDYIDVGWRMLGIPFGGPIKGRDLDGEAFHEDTDIWLNIGDKVNITYYHGNGPDDPLQQQENPAIIGKAFYVNKDNRGHWFDVRLDLDEPLAQRVVSVDMKKVGVSSGAIDHMVRMGKGGMINVWPIGEFALFDINDWRLPANRFAVVEAKAEKITEAVPEAVDAAVDAVDESADAIKTKTNLIEIPEEELIMTDEIKNDEIKNDETKNDEIVQEQPQPEPFDTKAFMEDLKKSIIDELKADRGIERGAPTVMKAAHLGDPDPVKDFNNWVRTGVGKIKKHTVEHELSDGKGGTYKAALQEGTDSEGGYLVPADYLNRIIEKRSEMNILTQLGVETYTTDRDVYKFPAENTAMGKFTIVAEEGSISTAQDEPTYTLPSAIIYKFMKKILISFELDEDYNTGLSENLSRMIGRSWAATENYYVQVGSGNNEPQGVFVGGTAGLTLDSASAIGVTEIPELIGKLKVPYRDRAVMLMNRTTGAYLSGLTGNQFQFRTPPVSQTWANGDDLGIGYPIILTEDAPAIGASNKSLLFGNFSFYGWVRNRSLRLQRLSELYAETGQIGLLAWFRAGGTVLQPEAFQYATHPTA